MTSKWHLSYAHTMLIQCSYNAHTMLIQCAYNAHTMLIQCSYNAHTMLIQCAYNAMLIQCSYNAHTMLIQCSYNAHAMLISLGGGGTCLRAHFGRAKKPATRAGRGVHHSLYLTLQARISVGSGRVEPPTVVPRARSSSRMHFVRVRSRVIEKSAAISMIGGQHFATHKIHFAGR